jgi:periplasmic copper chaperone A
MLTQRVAARKGVTLAKWSAIGRRAARDEIDHPPKRTGDNTMRKILGVVVWAMTLHWTAAALAGGVLDVEDAYASAVPPGQPNSAVFMRIVNRGVASRGLVSGKSDAADVVELHSHTMDEGMMRMRRIERIEIPGQGAVSLEPGGLHLMLIGLKRDLVPGDTLDLTLYLDDGTDLEVKVPVRAVQAMDHH